MANVHYPCSPDFNSIKKRGYLMVTFEYSHLILHFNHKSTILEIQTHVYASAFHNRKKSFGKNKVFLFCFYFFFSSRFYWEFFFKFVEKMFKSKNQ